MRAIHVALLSLAASTAAPVFAAPLPYFNARSKDGGAALSARGSHDGCTEDKPKSHVSEVGSDNPKQFNNRDAMEDFVTAIANMNARRSDIEQEVHARGSSDNAFGEESPTRVYNPNDFLAAMLRGRDVGSGEEIQARGLFSGLFTVGMDLLSQFLRRDVTPELLAARDGGAQEDLVNSILGSRDSTHNDGFTKMFNALAQASSQRDVADDELAARSDWEDLMNALNTRRDSTGDLVNSILGSRDPTSSDGFADALNALTSRRDVAADELAARSDSEDFVNALNTRRDIVDDFLNTPVPEHHFQEASPQKGKQARDIPVGSAKTAARDDNDSATNAFINALLNSRDSSKGELTTDEVLSLASLASRALDELD